MGAEDFPTALTTVERMLAGVVDDPAHLLETFRVLSKRRPVHLTADQLTRLFAVCYAVNGMGPDGPRDDIPDDTRGMLGSVCTTLIEGTFTDFHGEVRSWRRGSGHHKIAFKGSIPDYPNAPPWPLPHTPLDLAAAADLAQPYLAALETAMRADPYRHLQLCWQVAEYPIAPFDVIFSDWIIDLDRRGVGTGDTFTALRRARAWVALTRRGRQRLSRKAMDEEVMPQLSDPHPMVAAAAAGFVGWAYSDPERVFHHGEPEPLAEVLSMIAQLPANRRAVAGGFLEGFDAELKNPFTVMKSDDRLASFDVEDWVLQIFADLKEEVTLPSAQAFWFPVHEYYCHDPAFVSRMMDAGHLYEAMLCATEIAGVVDGMKPVLERLTKAKEGGVAAPADYCLRTYYAAV